MDIECPHALFQPTGKSALIGQGPKKAVGKLGFLLPGLEWTGAERMLRYLRRLGVHGGGGGFCGDRLLVVSIYLSIHGFVRLFED